MSKPELSTEFFQRATLEVARDLLGMTLWTHIDGAYCAGRIVETEAYDGSIDEACHAFRGKTPRTEVMFEPGGLFYVYFIYGMYYCVNVVTEGRDKGSAVLVRALEPLEGIEHMQRRRNKVSPRDLCSGPGKLCMAMGIGAEQNRAHCLTSGEIGISLSKTVPEASQIISSSRIGISKSQHLEWRFFYNNSTFVSNSGSLLKAPARKK